MKKLISKKLSLFLLYAILVSMTSSCCYFCDTKECCPPCPPDQANREGKLRGLYAKAYHGNHDITFHQAAFSGFDFLTNPTLHSDASTIAYGGFISKTTVNAILTTPAPTPNTGLYFYTCYRNSPKELFLAYKRVDEFRPNDDQLAPLTDMIYSSNNKILYLEVQPTNIGGIESFLTGHTMSAVNDNARDRRAGDVQTMGVDFISRYTGYNEKYFVYLPKNEIDSVLYDATSVGMNFYFGLDQTENTNKIRVFFIAVKNYAPYQRFIRENGKYQMILERSYP